MKRVLTIALTLVFVLSVFSLASLTVSAEALSATCTVTGAGYDVGASETYVTADVMFTSETAFAAGMFSVVADNLVFADCTVAQSLGGEDPEINLDLTQNKVMFTGFSFSPDDDIRSYTELTFVLKFVIEGTALSDVAAGTSWNINITDIDVVNIDEQEYIVDNATGLIHIHNYTGEWASDDEGHWNTCSVCEQDVKSAHTYQWVVTKEATEDEDGLKEEICSVCGHISGEQEAIIFKDYVPGDINGDSEVDNKDLIRLFQYLSNWEVEVNEDALDVNGDGSVDNKDLTRLFQYLSNWDVEIF